MTDIDRIEQINTLVSHYFEENEEHDLIAVKRLMPAFISGGIFNKDHRNGGPIREVLKSLDRDGKLELLPLLHVVRKGKDTFWYFKRKGHEPETLEVDRIPEAKNNKRVLRKQADSDTDYVIDLCDRVIRAEGLRRHTFDYLVGDLHRNGRSRSKLPCDAYYSKAKLVVEYQRPPMVDTVAAEDIPDGQENKAAERDKRHATYLQRKKDILPRKGITVEVLDSTLFDLDEKGHIRRDRTKDMKRVIAALGKYAPEV